LIIKDLFEYEIDREIPEVIKLEDSENTRVLQELNEYVFTDALLKKYEEIFQKITKSTSESTQNVNVWISGYYGSGKSHFIKLLYHILKNEHINGISPTEILFNPKKVKSDINDKI
jgi:predicted AAA+ superfamily ATPase